MLPLLKFIFHDGVRSAAAESFPYLLNCAKPNGVAYQKQMWDTILLAYKEAISKESDLDVLCEMLNGVGLCVEELGEEIISNQDMECIFTIVHEQLNNFEKRRAEREKSSKDEEVDEEYQETLNEIIETETSILARISDINHFSFQAFKTKLLPIFHKLVPQYSALLHDNRPYQDRQWGICIFDDHSLSYQEIFYKPMLQALSNDFPEVRQAAAYGFGIMALKGGPAYAQHCASVIEPLASCITRTDAKSTEESISATENAISAVAKILKFNSSAVDTNRYIPAFLSWLPVYNDTDEVPYVYDYFCDLIENNHPLILGENNSNLPKIFEIILYTFSHGTFEEEPSEPLNAVKVRLATIMKMIKENDELFRGIIGNLHLNSHQQQSLLNILS